jgi:hypothetical protein
MARLRTLKPGFFHNEELAEVDPLGRLLFAGLWTIADREGRLEDRPKRIKAEVLPYDDCDPDDLLQQLADRDFVTRYDVDGRKCIAMNKWHAHQRPHPHEAASALQAPPSLTVSADSRDKVVPKQDLGSDEPVGNLGLGSGGLEAGSGGLEAGSGVKNLESPTRGRVGDSSFLTDNLRELVNAIGVQKLAASEVRVLFAPPLEQVQTIMDWWPKREGVKRAEGLLAALTEDERLIVLRVSWTLHRLIESNPTERRWVRKLEPWVSDRHFEDWEHGIPEPWAKKNLRWPVPWGGHATLTGLLDGLETRLEARLADTVGEAENSPAPEPCEPPETSPGPEASVTPPEAADDPLGTPVTRRGHTVTL